MHVESPQHLKHLSIGLFPLFFGIRLIKYPKLIERPVVVSDNRAILGRPPEKVLDII